MVFEANESDMPTAFTTYKFHDGQPFKTILIEEDPDNKCPVCHDPIQDGTIVVHTEICPHLYCPACYADSRLVSCAGCTQRLMSGEAVCVRLVTNVDSN